MKKSYSLSFEDWKSLFRASFTAYPILWWRISAINIAVILMIIVGFIVSAAIGFWLIGGYKNAENIVANIQMGGSLGTSELWIAGITLFIFINWVIVFSITGKIANLLVVKSYSQKQSVDPFITFFSSCWKFFWDYVLLGIRVFWYICWPLFLFISLFFWGTKHDISNSLIYYVFFGVIQSV